MLRRDLYAGAFSRHDHDMMSYFGSMGEVFALLATLEKFFEETSLCKSQDILDNIVWSA